MTENTTRTNDTKESKGFAEFEELMQGVAELPEEQREKVAYFAQGVMAAANTPRKACNE